MPWLPPGRRSAGFEPPADTARMLVPSREDTRCRYGGDSASARIGGVVDQAGR